MTVALRSDNSQKPTINVAAYKPVRADQTKAWAVIAAALLSQQKSAHRSVKMAPRDMTFAMRSADPGWRERINVSDKAQYLKVVARYTQYGR